VAGGVKYEVGPDNDRSHSGCCEGGMEEKEEEFKERPNGYPYSNV